TTMGKTYQQPQAGELREIQDPNDPYRTVQARIGKDNTLSIVGGTSKLKPPVQAEIQKADSVARDAETQFGILQNLIKQKNSTADQDITVRYFDIVMPVVGRRMSDTELSRLQSVVNIRESAKILLQKFGSLELFTDEVRNEIVQAARANIEGKRKAAEDLK